MGRFIHRFARDERGSIAVEFAMLSPLLFTMIFGVIQIGVSMQSYNAMRSICSETARYAIVEYMKKNEVSNDDIAAFAENVGESDKYLFMENLQASVTDATSRVSTASEKTLTVRYTPPALVAFLDWAQPELTFTRPIFLIRE